jgi:predicted nuclease with TOPRIM domain
MQQCTENASRLSVEGVGGIGSTEVTLTRGVTALVGRNATNRTSLLRGVMAALGSDDVSLKGDAQRGVVELEVDGERYTRTLKRHEDGVRLDGEPYLEDSTPADLFAFLTEANEARQAVARGEDLRELIMRPVDTEAIRTEVEELEADRRELDDELERLEGLARELVELESTREGLREELETTREELETTREELEAGDATVAESREQRGELDATLDSLRDVRSDLESTKRRLRMQRESREALVGDREEAREALDALPEPTDGVLERTEREVERLRDHRRTVESTVSQLQKVIQFNEEMLQGAGPDLGGALDGPEGADGSVTDRLLADGTVTCWTCGSDVDGDAIEETIEDLRAARREHVETRSDLADDLEELKAEREAVERRRVRRTDLEDEMARIERELADREDTIAELEDRRETLEGEVERLESRVSELESDRHDSMLELHREVNRLEFDAERLERDLRETSEAIEAAERELSDRDRLEERRSVVSSRIEDCRTRIERLESRAVEAFNTHMADILDVLDYENVQRIWIERQGGETREGARTVERNVFEMHVVRSTASGAAYEDTVDHLSESEREVTGLVFALAGYLVHDVHETVPFMMLDSLEALDADRIATLIEYFGQYPDYLVVALLPEDAAALDDGHRRVTTI